MSTQKKQLGDLVRINRGEYKDRTGVLEAKEQRNWVVKLETGETVSVPFPFVEVIASPLPQPVSNEIQENETAVEAQAEEQTESTPPETDSPVEVTTEAIQTEQTQTSESAPQELTAAESEIKKLSVKQLQELAKQRGIGIARTKADFLRIIQKTHPEEDLTLLKGPVLFNRVTELHISRLRSKEDLQNLLSAN